MLYPGFNGKKSQKIENIQDKLIKFLKDTKDDSAEFVWEKEYVDTQENRKRDRIDIFGEVKNIKLNVVIELDAHRADQVAKKFLSRQALFHEKNLIYISLCYPGTNNMSQNECIKTVARVKIILVC
jgi:hypothetical protein